MILDIDSLGGGGRGVARHEGRVVFVAGALPGERVEAVVERERAGIVEARAVRIVERSAWREPEPCPHAGACGGCDLAHLGRSNTAQALRELVAGALRHAPVALAERVRAAEVFGSPSSYRLRARLHWDSRAGILGFLGPRSYEVADVPRCTVIAPLLARSRPALAEELAASRLPDGQVEWLEDLSGERGIAGWRGRGRPPEAEIAGLEGWHRLGPAGDVRPGGWGSSTVQMALPVPLQVPIGAFFQGNRHLVGLLFERVAALSAGAARAVDLFAGVGFLAAAARHGGVPDLVLVETQPAAAAAAASNLPDAWVEATTAERFLRRPGPAEATVALVDPPRTGLSSAARAALVDWRPERVLLLSCDASRFGRDAAALMAGGYELRALELWELFRGSHHVEILALFGR